MEKNLFSFPSFNCTYELNSANEIYSKKIHEILINEFNESLSEERRTSNIFPQYNNDRQVKRDKKNNTLIIYLNREIINDANIRYEPDFNDPKVVKHFSKRFRLLKWKVNFHILVNDPTLFNYIFPFALSLLTIGEVGLRSSWIGSFISLFNFIFTSGSITSS